MEKIAGWKVELQDLLGDFEYESSVPGRGQRKLMTHHVDALVDELVPFVEARLAAAELEAARLRVALDHVARSRGTNCLGNHGAPCDCVGDEVRAALAAPPPDLSALRKLIRAAQRLLLLIRRDHLDMGGAAKSRNWLRVRGGGISAGKAVTECVSALSAALVAHPWLLPAEEPRADA